MLFNYRAKVDLLNMWKYTLLHYAVLAGYLSVLKLLVESGADVRLKNEDGETARDVAWSEGKEAVAEWLELITVCSAVETTCTKHSTCLYLDHAVYLCTVQSKAKRQLSSPTECNKLCL
jgi:hypothetical protein